MNSLNHVLIQYLGEQIALEEQLCSVIENQILEIDEETFSDAKTLLVKTKQVLEEHFIPLNETLDNLEQDVIHARKKSVAGNGAELRSSVFQGNQSTRLSTLLRNDYSALNLITTGNTLLYTAALALDCQAVATIALKHLQNLAPIVIKIGELLPEVVAQELRSESPKMNPSVGRIALKNTQLAWQNAE